MQLSIERLRWGLIAGALLLVVTLTAYIGYGRYRALRTYRQLLKHSGISITHETDGFTYSQSVQGKTIFTIHAAKAVQVSDGHYSLHDAVLTFYGRQPGEDDHVYGSVVEYDEKEGVARAQGEVNMDLHAPKALTSGGHAQPEPSPAAGGKTDDSTLIHVRTSGLVYLRKLGLATTDQQVEIRYGGVLCTARGAEFNTDQSTLRLLADIQVSGETNGQPVQMTATSAYMDRTADTASLTLPVVTSLGRSARADAATVTLRSDGSIDHVEAGNHVVLQSKASAGMQQVTASRLEATLTPDTVLQTARLSGGVLLTDSNPLRPMHGSATQMDATFTEQGAPASITATGAAKISMVDRRSGSQGLARDVEAEKIVALFAPGAKRPRLRQVTATGAARARAESAAASPKGTLKSTLVAGDELRLGFLAGAAGRSQPQTLSGSGHTLLQQDAPLNEQQRSTGDKLEMTFAQARPNMKPGGAQDEFAISSAVQSGHVQVHDHAPDRTGTKPGTSAQGAVSTASAERAAYDGATQKLSLTGTAHLTNDNASLTAQTVTMDRQSHNAEAFGNVQATLENAAPASGQEQAATHVLAASAQFDDLTKVAIFRGTDAQPARVWQLASQVQAAELIFDGENRTFSARPAGAGGMIHAVFAGMPSQSAKPASKTAVRSAADNFVRVTSPTMDYNDVQREATFSGRVQMEGTLGEIRSQRALVYLTPVATAAEKKPSAAQPSPINGSLDHVIVLGALQMEQPGRHGTGEQLVYTAATGNFVLTGTADHRPMVVDALQGSVTGTSLTFGAAGSTIVVAGEPGSSTVKHARVHTETEVRQ
jgi:lipopolysaccharide export system protein LptA